MIEWRDHELGELYQRLSALKKSHRALWNGAWGAPMVRVTNDAEAHVLSFVRRSPSGEGVDAITDQPCRMEPGTRLALPAWGWVVRTSPGHGS